MFYAKFKKIIFVKKCITAIAIDVGLSSGRLRMNGRGFAFSIMIITTKDGERSLIASIRLMPLHRYLGKAALKQGVRFARLTESVPSMAQQVNKFGNKKSDRAVYSPESQLLHQPSGLASKPCDRRLSHALKRVTSCITAG